jgi:Spy/CpxP family protein refolding chaperone
MNFFKKTKFLIAVIIILSAIILAIFGTMGFHHYSMERRERNEFREHQPGKYIANQLQLTPEQIKDFDSLRDKFHSELEAITKDSKDVSREIMEEIMSDKPDTTKLRVLAEKFGKQQEQQKQITINHLLEIKGKCSVSQQAYFKKLIKQMENHDRENRERVRNNERRGRDKD